MNNDDIHFFDESERSSNDPKNPPMPDSGESDQADVQHSSQEGVPAGESQSSSTGGPEVFDAVPIQFIGEGRGLQDTGHAPEIYAANVSATVAPASKPNVKSRFGVWFLAWPILLLLVGFLVSQPYLFPPPDSAEPQVSFAEVSALEMQGKYTVGTLHFAPMAAGQQDQIKQDLLVQSSAMNTGSFESRLCFVIMTGELAGPEEALSALDEVMIAANEAGYTPTEMQSQLHQSLSLIYRDYSNENWRAPSLSAEQQESLENGLGWFGELALTPELGPNEDSRRSLIASARRTVVVVIVAGIGMLTVGFSSFVLFVIYVVQLVRGKIVSGLVWKTENGNIYIETFALWMVLFLALSFVSILIIPEDWPLMANAFVQLASLSAMLWPLVRGISFKKLCEEIGWTVKNPIVETFWGVVSYIAALPLIVFGMICTLMMTVLAGSLNPVGEFESAQGPSHPIGEWITEGGWMIVFPTLFLAAVCAPIVEETMFRGVLYRHLRDVSAKARLVGSILIATFVNALIFASIHPQGILGIPLLMALATAFSLVREWRGSLIAPMVMHAVNNASATLLVALAF